MKSARHVGAILLLIIFHLNASACLAAFVESDGSDGPFTPPGPGLITLDLPSDGVFHFTEINIPGSVILKFNRNAANTPVFLAATGSVLVAGIIDVSATATDVLLPPVAENPKQSSGPGGFDGGNGGIETSSEFGENGGGNGAGGGGFSAGGAGNATAGHQASRYSNPGSLGEAGSLLPYPEDFIGGSGGGGGDAIYWFGWYRGGYGGGGGGALNVSAHGEVIITGMIKANGANGGWGQASALAHGGAGGGGAGGVIELHGSSITLGSAGHLQALGGYGGGLSTQPYSQDPPAYSSGADGGLGYIRLVASDVSTTGTMSGIVSWTTYNERDLFYAINCLRVVAGIQPVFVPDPATDIDSDDRIGLAEAIHALATEACLLDSDGDSVLDCQDSCPGFDDGLDADGDSIPDGCDSCDGTVHCGESCCVTGQICLDNTTCCATSNVCGTNCCPPGYFCCPAPTPTCSVAPCT